MLVLVGSKGAAISSAVEEELAEFSKTGRMIIPIDLGGVSRRAKWWPLIEGLPVSVEGFVPPGYSDAIETGEPSPAILARSSERRIR